MSRKNNSIGVFDQIKAGLQDSIAFSRGELSLVTIRLPAPPPKADSKRIAALRKDLRMSQAVFAATLNVSKRTVQSWEQGLREPGDAASRLIEIIGRKPDVVQMILSGSAGERQKNRLARAGSGTLKKQEA